MATRARAEAVDEEFLYALYRGGELLAAGKVIEAKDHLERAFKLQPKNEKGQNLLGLTYFKLGLFDRASEIYEMLVRENPADPTLRVNLGLVYLKTNALQRAIREFEVATDLAPDHKKSHNYLGLALAQGGEYGRAREHFLLAGSDAMAQKMERALNGESILRPAAARANGAAPPSEPGESEWVAPPEESPPPEPAGSPAAQEAAQQGEVQIDLMSDDQVPAEELPPPPAVSPLHSDASWGDQFGLEGEEPAAGAVPTPGEAEGRLDEGALAARPGATAEAPPLPEAAPVAVVLESAPTEAGPELDAAPVPPDELESGDEPIPLVVLARPKAEEDPSELPHAVTGIPPESTELPPEPSSTFTPPPVAPIASMSTLARVEASTVEVSPDLIRDLERPTAKPSPPPVAVDGAPPTLAQLSPKLALAPKPGGPFVVDGDTIVLHVRDELLTRLSGLMGYTGRLEFSPEMKRFRGRHTDKPFGEGEARISRVKGKGLIALDAGKHLFVPLDLGDDSAYFREDVVFAFEEPVMFENGRVPSDVPPDLDLVHLRGNGKVLLALAGPLRALEVKMDLPVTLPLSQLVGWHGNLTPRTVPVGWDAKGRPSRAGVELSGEGFALFALPVG
jgi:hypothetical protein